MTTRKKTATIRKHDRASPATQDKLPVIEHLRELRRRFLYIAVAVITGGVIAYGFEHRLIDVLLGPIKGQQLIYTSPVGGMNFLLALCLIAGLLVATPVIIYQLLAFIRPLMRHTTRKFLLTASAAAGIMALVGVVFGYFVGLPSSLHFLLNQFTTDQVQPLLTIQAYTQFVALYLLGSSLMFQLPLIVLFINRIKPLKPQSLLKYEKHAAVGTLIIGLIMNPSPRLVDQFLVVVPMFASYQTAILVLWLAQRKQTSPRWLQTLKEQDAQRQAERLARKLQPFTVADVPMLPETVVEVTPIAPAKPIAKPIVVIMSPTKDTVATPAKPAKPRRLMDFAPNTKPSLMPLHGRIQIAIQ